MFEKKIHTVCSRQAALVSDRIVESLDSFDESSFRRAFRLARAACAAPAAGARRPPPPGRSHYGEWFAAAFGQESTSLVSARASRRFGRFLQLLSRMVPGEDSSCLTAHLSNRPFMPAAHRDAWREYVVLAKRRLEEDVMRMATDEKRERGASAFTRIQGKQIV